jgi:Ca-activated chloride channel family protein
LNASTLQRFNASTLQRFKKESPMFSRTIRVIAALVLMVILVACGSKQQAAAPAPKAAVPQSAEQSGDTATDGGASDEEDAAAEKPMEMEEEAAEAEVASERTPEPVEVNPFTLTSQDHLSTFGLDVDTASYTAARNYITNGSLPPESEVRVEEFINYFDYGYTPPQEDALAIALDAAPLPWASIEGQQTQLVRVGIQGKHIDDSERDDASLIFVIDVSGSMAEPNRLPMVKESLTLLVEKLRETDQVGIVVYSDDTRVVLEPTSAANREVILRAINSLEIEGATNVEAGLRLGYEMAAEHFKVGGINRVILCSDGVANVGATGPDAIREVIRDHTAQGVLLTTVGFGMGDYNDHLMEQLADDGNGNYAYVDTLEEARRVFVENLTGMLQVIAKDAKVQVDFNPEVVHSYRLLGYENRDIADEDFRNEKVDAGEVGVDHNVTALYEVVLQNEAAGDAITVYLRYKHPQSGEVTELEQPLATDAFGTSFNEMSPQFRLAVAVAGFAEQLRGSGYAQDRSMADILAIAEPVAQEMANDAEVQEFVELVRQASDL